MPHEQKIRCFLLEVLSLFMNNPIRFDDIDGFGSLMWASWIIHQQYIGGSFVSSIVSTNAAVP
jgi:hypothetical protein